MRVSNAWTRVDACCELLTRDIRLAALFAVVAIGEGIPSQPAFAQTAIDSVRSLARTHHWEPAALLARRALVNAKALNDRCVLQMNLMWSSWHLTRGNVRQSFAMFSRECYDWAPEDQFDAMAVDSLRVQVPLLDRLAYVRNDRVQGPDTTRVDISCVRSFFEIADFLSEDLIPPDSLWRQLAGTSGYQLLGMYDLPRKIALALMPSNKRMRDSLYGSSTADMEVLRHLQRAAALKRTLLRLADSVSASSVLRIARGNALSLLPRNAMNGAMPVVAFCVFQPEAIARQHGVVVDLLYARDVGVTSVLSHEIHHVLVERITTMRRADAAAVDAPLVNALFQLRNEGLADMLDKRYPIDHELFGTEYASEYDAAYRGTPQTMVEFDSLLSRVNAGSSMSAYRAIAELFPMNGHPNGAHIARAIIATFGVDSLIPAMQNPVALLRTYNAARAVRGEVPPLSDRSLEVLGLLERKYGSVSSRAPKD